MLVLGASLAVDRLPMSSQNFLATAIQAIQARLAYHYSNARLHVTITTRRYD